MLMGSLNTINEQLTNADLRDFLKVVTELMSGQRTELPPG